MSEPERPPSFVRRHAAGTVTDDPDLTDAWKSIIHNWLIDRVIGETDG